MKQKRQRELPARRQSLLCRLGIHRLDRMTKTGLVLDVIVIHEFCPLQEFSDAEEAICRCGKRGAIYQKSEWVEVDPWAWMGDEYRQIFIPKFVAEKKERVLFVDFRKHFKYRTDYR